MNRINRDNYEAFLLDMVEGTISAADHDELVLFLAQNPDLDIDLDGLEYATLDEEGIVFDSKEDLKKTEASRFDFLAIKQLEEGLTATEQKELDSFVSSDKKYALALTAFSKTKLVADASIVFPNKASLKHGAVIRPLWVNSLRAAAAVALLIGGVYAFQQLGPTQQDGVANVIDNKGKTIPTVDIKLPAENNFALVNTNTPTQQVKVLSPKKNNAIVPDNNTIEYAKATPVTIGIANASVDFIPTQLDMEQPVASYMVVPYLDIPQEKPTLLNSLMAGLRKRIDTGVKDEELALRLDTITQRGPELSDLAFFGSKGFEKLTGYKPDFRRTDKDDSQVSSLSIGRYTIGITRPKREE